VQAAAALALLAAAAATPACGVYKVAPGGHCWSGSIISRRRAATIVDESGRVHQGAA